MQGPGKVYLDWKTPIIGGKGGPVRAYVIYRREQPQGGGAFASWEQAGMALETHALLSNQSQRREIEYRIIGVNSAGISVPSNTAAVVFEGKSRGSAMNVKWRKRGEYRTRLSKPSRINYDIP